MFPQTVFLKENKTIYLTGRQFSFALRYRRKLFSTIHNLGFTFLISFQFYTSSETHVL